MYGSGQPYESLPSPYRVYSKSMHAKTVDCSPCVVQSLSTLVTVFTVVLIFCTTAAETAVGNWLYTYGVREVSNCCRQLAVHFWRA